MRFIRFPFHIQIIELIKVIRTTVFFPSHFFNFSFWFYILRRIIDLTRRKARALILIKRGFGDLAREETIFKASNPTAISA